MELRYRALIFDLFGTLVEAFPWRAHNAVILTMADLLQVPLADFAPFWPENLAARHTTGTVMSIEEYLVSICQHLKIAPDVECLQQIARVRAEFERRMLIPKPGTIEILTQLKREGYRMGVLSNCGVDVPRFWQTTPFAEMIDAPVFSCEVNLRKPDPQIYLLVCEQLGVAPYTCVYVGDGSDGELTGAKQAGLIPVLVGPSLIEADSAQHLEVATWNGLVIPSLTDLPALLEGKELPISFHGSSQ